MDNIINSLETLTEPLNSEAQLKLAKSQLANSEHYAKHVTL